MPTEQVECSRSSINEKPDVVMLKRQVGFIGGVSLIVGTIIGSGIFISPKGVFANAGSLGTGLVIWSACGVLSMFGALTYAELGTMIPKSGGEFPILLEAYGPIPAYLFAWTATVMLKPSSLCLLSLTFAKYALAPAYGDCDDVPELATKFTAAVVILTTVFCNCISVKLSTKVVTVFGIGKILSLVIIIVAGIVRFCQGYSENFSNSFSGTSPGIREVTMAFYQGLWAFDGWNQLNYVIEELKDPYKTLPRALAASMLIVTGLYVMTNIAYFTTMTFDELLASPAVAVTMGNVVLGVMVWIIPFAVSCSVFGTCVGSCFTAGRISYAAAREGHFNQVLSMLQVKRLTPAPAVLLNGFIALLMVIPNDFDTLVQYYSFATWAFYFATCSALFYFRIKMPDRHRPVKVPIFIPIIFSICSLCLVLVPIIDNPQIQYFIAVLSILFGLVFYFPFVHYKLKSKKIRKLNEFLQKMLLVALPEADL
ncbi:b(0,+)-type amino acid transporter 1-like [Clavelina lepadiformis]|uniref:b(0,+)-type amino acid transporter 1-like n=1 Tax=Clavelina lepadiformis TaxID=159417 RepID=UPI00404107FA